MSAPLPLTAKIYSPRTMIKNIIKGAKDNDTVTIGDMFSLRANFQAVYGRLLMACEDDQVESLLHLWNRYIPDDDVILTWRLIVKQGYYPQFLNASLLDNANLFKLVYSAVQAGKEANDSASDSPAEYRDQFGRRVRKVPRGPASLRDRKVKAAGSPASG